MSNEACAIEIRDESSCDGGNGQFAYLDEDGRCICCTSEVDYDDMDSTNHGGYDLYYAPDYCKTTVYELTDSTTLIIQASVSETSVLTQSSTPEAIFQNNSSATC